MIIRDFFEKNINRNIETVIKADDREHISDEIAEYVITREIYKKIQPLFDDYINYAEANGVWISGFFGSGKSHLLKIMSYVLENKEHDGYYCGELFAEKIENDEMLKGNVLAATRIPSESILFNIDQQSQEAGNLLMVFYKVFFDHLGYYGFQTHVAEFEMWLDRQGKYPEFKKQFNLRHGKTWEKARRDYYDPSVTGDIAVVLGEMNGHDPAKYENILDEIEDKQKHSIEDLCTRINDYIKSKGAGFRLNFYIDEIGQYISGDSRLMLNIQTIAETLATKTRGRSWIFVTSQEDMEKVVGDMTRTQQNDFSRIQARFKYKIPLTSANVDEVIEKRLLKKKNEARAILTKLWQAENANLDTLLSFSEPGIQFRKFKDQDDFINKYPFISYQFSLFQECRRALSSHNAFQGRHQSVGERSMLGVFQQVAKSIENLDETCIVSFDKMYEGIRNELKGEIQKAIILAENNLDNLFAVQVLKTLFMVKYFNNFKTTRRNISVLMIDHIRIDLKAHEKRIDEALNTLENQNYITRNGDLFEFMTDDEKDVEESIKNIDPGDQAVTQLLKELFFDEIIQDSRLRFNDNKNDYEFSAKIDGVLLGREKELVIEIITQNNPEFENEILHQSQTMGAACMKLVLPPDTVFTKDVKLYLQTYKFLRVNQDPATRPEITRIYQEKAQLNAERKRNLIAIANRLLAGSQVFMNGARHHMNQHNDGKTRVVNAFQDLVKITYPSLRMLGSVIFSEDTIRSTITRRADELFKSDVKTMTEAETEVLTAIKRRQSMAERTYLSDLREAFSRKPYGWYPNAIWTIIAMLFKRDCIEMRQESNLLGDNDALVALLNNRNHNTTLIEPKAIEKPEDIRALKKLYTDLFDETTNANTGKEVGAAFRLKLEEMSVEINKLLVGIKDYPFVKALAPMSELADRLLKKDYAYYLTKRNEYEDELLEHKEQLLDPIKRFLNGEQRRIYDSIRTLLNADTSNLYYIKGEELDAINAAYGHPKPFAGSLIRDAKSALDSLKTKLLTQIEEEKSKAIFDIQKCISELEQMEEFSQLNDADKARLLKPFKDEIARLKTQRYIATIRDIRHMVNNSVQQKALNDLIRMTAPVSPDEQGNVRETAPHYISKNSINLYYSKSELRTEEDVDDYVETIRRALKEQIRNNRRIKL